VYQEEVHIPLILKSPRRADGQRVARRVHHADIMPSVLRLLGVSNPVPVEGTDLFAPKRRIPLVSYLGPYQRTESEHAVFDDNLKLIVNSDSAPKLFDLQNDPGERSDLGDERTADVARLMDLYEKYLDRGSKTYRDDCDLDDKETRERLLSLGYGGR
jgi:arylsulfatase A-like enzyme